MNSLLNRTLFILLFSAILIVGFSSVLQFFWIKDRIEKKIDHTLIQEKNRLNNKLTADSFSSDSTYKTTRNANVKLISFIDFKLKDSLYNQKVYIEGDLVSFRTLQTSILLNNKKIKIEIRKEIEDNELVLDSLYLNYILTLLLIVLLFLLFKYFLLKNTWLPFFKTLKTLKYSDLQNELVTFSSEVKIKEFRDLNNELSILAKKIYEEFQSQKKFIENLNHELMTPLAIIRAKLELIIQSENLKKNDLKLVSDIFITIDRLTKLNKSLVLISKIENNQFEEVENVSVLKCINEVLDSFEDQIRAKEIQLRKEVKSNKFIEANEMLIFVLFSNLIKNSIFHNLDTKGTIELEITEDYVLISNTGKNTIPKENIFERFVTGKKTENSIGLGLSIVERICTLYKLSVTHNQIGNKHSFLIKY